MGIKYTFDSGLQAQAEEISKLLFPHVKLDRVKCFRSKGSSSSRTIARCHTIGKLMQKTIGCEPHYALEFISERFDKMSEEQKTKVIIHELMHIPFTFGGGFKHHDWVCDSNIDKLYRTFSRTKNGENSLVNDAEKTKSKPWW
ncbi:MAG: putative metallopeptidase [Candidatus Pacearchaeota archaeon]|jgi:predicted metallopeptidase